MALMMVYDTMRDLLYIGLPLIAWLVSDIRWRLRSRDERTLSRKWMLLQAMLRPRARLFLVVAVCSTVALALGFGMPDPWWFGMIAVFVIAGNGAWDAERERRRVGEEGDEGGGSGQGPQEAAWVKLVSIVGTFVVVLLCALASPAWVIGAVVLVAINWRRRRSIAVINIIIVILTLVLVLVLLAGSGVEGEVTTTVMTTE
jgi:hypothetical protein